MNAAASIRLARSHQALITLSMTQFVNFVLKDGPGQLTAVRTIKKQHQDGYDVPPDLYKQFRDGLVQHHRRGQSKEALDSIATSQREPTRQQEYPVLVAGYKRFWGRKALNWFKPAEGRWEFGGLSINIKPELGLLVDDCGDQERILVKLYLNKPNEDDESAMNMRRAAVVTHLMRLALNGATPVSTPAVLDVRRGRLFRPEPLDSAHTALLHGQSRAFVEMYRAL